MKKNILLIAIATVIAILVSSCGNGNNGNDNNNAPKEGEVAITLPAADQPMVIKTGFYGDIYKAGTFASKDGKIIHVEYCMIYWIEDADVTPLARALEGRNIPDGLRADQYYYQLYVQPVIMKSLQKKIGEKNAAEVNKKDLTQEIQNALDNASLIYQTTFKMQLGITSR
jgi:hypothetical protein